MSAHALMPLRGQHAQQGECAENMFMARCQVVGLAVVIAPALSPDTVPVPGHNELIHQLMHRLDALAS